MLKWFTVDHKTFWQLVESQNRNKKKERVINNSSIIDNQIYDQHQLITKSKIMSDNNIKTPEIRSTLKKNNETFFELRLKEFKTQLCPNI